MIFRTTLLHDIALDNSVFTTWKWYAQKYEELIIHLVSQPMYSSNRWKLKVQRPTYGKLQQLVPKRDFRDVRSDVKREMGVHDSMWNHRKRCGFQSWNVPERSRKNCMPLWRHVHLLGSLLEVKIVKNWGSRCVRWCSNRKRKISTEWRSQIDSRYMIQVSIYSILIHVERGIYIYIYNKIERYR